MTDSEELWEKLSKKEKNQRLWTGHYRILDPKNIRRAWGNELAIEQLFEKILNIGEIND